jgi:hypothetical protein
MRKKLVFPNIYYNKLNGLKIKFWTNPKIQKFGH